MGADTTHGPAWYRAIGAMGSVTSQPPGRPVGRRMGPALGSLGDDAAAAPPSLTTSTLATPSLFAQAPDPITLAWQTNVLAQLQAGVATLQKAELQKWLQIAATLAIPLSAAVWKAIFKKGAASSVV